MHIPLSVVAGALAIAEPRDACTSLQVPLHDAIVLVDRGACSFVEKSLNVQAAGAWGIIVMNNVHAESAFAMGFDQQHDAVNIIAMMVSKEAGLELQQIVLQLELHSQQTYVDVQADALSTSTDIGSRETIAMEQHVYVPDATQSWLQTHDALQSRAVQGSTAPTWQSLLMDLASSLHSLQNQMPFGPSSLMEGPSQQCVEAD